MTAEDRAELRRLAEQAQKECPGEHTYRYLAAVQPARVLALLDRLAELEAWLKELEAKDYEALLLRSIIEGHKREQDFICRMNRAADRVAALEKRLAELEGRDA